jgi:hypothetical protein
MSKQLNPINMAKDDATNAALKDYFTHLGPLITLYSSPWISAVSNFMRPAGTATDLDELNGANDIIQNKVITLLKPYLNTNWHSSVQTAIDAASSDFGNSKRDVPAILPAK